MYYAAGTYEAFAHCEKPRDADKKSAYIIGTGLAGLTAAFYATAACEMVLSPMAGQSRQPRGRIAPRPPGHRPKICTARVDKPPDLCYTVREKTILQKTGDI